MKVFFFVGRYPTCFFRIVAPLNSQTVYAIISGEMLNVRPMAIGLQEKQEAEKAANQPSCIPGYFDPTSISVCIPTTEHTVTFAAGLVRRE